MKKVLLSLCSCFLLLDVSFAQPAIQWQKCLGGTGYDYAYSVEQTADGGYIVGGSSKSDDGDVTGNHSIGVWDYWVVKLDGSGNIQWQKCLGGTNDDVALSVQQAADGGYIVAGWTQSNDGDVTGHHGGGDYWIVRLDSNGSIQWQKCLGGTSSDAAYSIQQTADGGYVVAGWTLSTDGDVTGNHGNYDYWVVKLNTNGNLQWQKCLGGTGEDVATSVQPTTGGGYVVAGYTKSNNGNVTGNHGGGDYWIVRLDSSGSIQWQKCLGGTNNDEAFSVEQTVDGGFIVAGYTESNDGDVAGNHGVEDYWVVKLDSNGNIQWQKCLGGTGYDWANSVQQTADLGFIVTGYSTSSDGDVTGNHDTTGSYADYWIIKLNSIGNPEWQKCCGGTNEDLAYSVQQTADEGFIIAGSTKSNSGDVMGSHDTASFSSDSWIIKLSPYVGMEDETNNAAFNVCPNPFTTHAVISFTHPVYNATFSLYNLLGEKVSGAAGVNGESFDFNRGNLQSGVYVFEVREKEKSIAVGKAILY